MNFTENRSLSPSQQMQFHLAYEKISLHFHDDDDVMAYMDYLRTHQDTVSTKHHDAVVKDMEQDMSRLYSEIDDLEYRVSDLLMECDCDC